MPTRRTTSGNAATPVPRVYADRIRYVSRRRMTHEMFIVGRCPACGETHWHTGSGYRLAACGTGYTVVA